MLDCFSKFVYMLLPHKPLRIHRKAVQLDDILGVITMHCFIFRIKGVCNDFKEDLSSIWRIQPHLSIYCFIPLFPLLENSMPKPEALNLPLFFKIADGHLFQFVPLYLSLKLFPELFEIKPCDISVYFSVYFVEFVSQILKLYCKVF